MATFQEIASSLMLRIKGYKKFKIGKTGRTCKERFEDKHHKNYSYYEEIGYSIDPHIIDECE